MASVEVPGTARADLGLGGIRRCTLPVGPQLSVDGLKTIFEVFQRSVLNNPNGNCLGRRPILKDGSRGPYVWINYKTVYERSMNFGCGLQKLNCCVANSVDGLRALGFYSKNRPEYVIGDMGCYSQMIIPVPLYDTLGADSVEYCVRQTELKALLVSTEVFPNVVEVAQKGLLTTAIIMDAYEQTAEKVADLKKQGSACGLQVLTIEEVEALGKANPSPPVLPSGDDVAFFCYTSGTTGDPKGAQIRHSGIISCLAGLRSYGLEMFPTDVHLCYLPLPHVFERAILLSVLYGGGAVGFYQGDTVKILEDIVALRPTIFPSVPRLLNRVYDKLVAGVKEAGGFKQWLFERALAAKVAGLREGKLTHPIYDRLVFRAVKERIGFDRVRMIMTGSAPIASHVLDFFRAVFACPVCEGYGQTESSLLITFTPIDDTTTGHVGVPAPCNEIRLVDIPDMKYLSTDKKHSDGSACMGRGEIVFRGPNVFKGYYRMEDKTAETIDSQGWCYTGDVGMWTPDGKLRIIDRKKAICKLSQGEYVAVEKVENVLQRSPIILQCFVHGDSLQNSLVCVAVPDPEWLAANKMTASDPKLLELVMKSIVEEAKKAELKGFEIPKAVYLDATPFDQPAPAKDGMPARIRLLTPTFKLQRNKAKEYYKDMSPVIDKLYEQVNAQEKKAKL